MHTHTHAFIGIITSIELSNSLASRSLAEHLKVNQRSTSHKNHAVRQLLGRPKTIHVSVCAYENVTKKVEDHSWITLCARDSVRHQVARTGVRNGFDGLLDQSPLNKNNGPVKPVKWFETLETPGASG